MGIILVCSSCLQDINNSLLELSRKIARENKPTYKF